MGSCRGTGKGVAPGPLDGSCFSHQAELFLLFSQFCWILAQCWQPSLSCEKDNIKAPWKMRRWLWLVREAAASEHRGRSCPSPSLGSTSLLCSRCVPRLARPCTTTEQFSGFIHFLIGLRETDLLYVDLDAGYHFHTRNLLK